MATAKNPMKNTLVKMKSPMKSTPMKNLPKGNIKMTPVDSNKKNPFKKK